MNHKLTNGQVREIMEKRWHMRTKDGYSFMEMPHTDRCKQIMKDMRYNNPERWKYQRIQEVIQAYPSKVKVGQIHKYT